MVNFDEMITSAQQAMIHVLNLNTTDKVLVVSDEDTKDVGEAFQNAALDYGCSVDSYFLNEKDRPLIEIPEQLNELTKNKTVIINAFKGLSDETPFRVKWVKKILATERIRLGHGAGITNAMMIEGPMNIDYELMVKTANIMKKKFENAKIAHVTAPGGTDIVLDIENRGFSTDVQITTVPYFANLPCGEIWCGPVESKGDGIIVCDGSIGDIGKVMKPLKITVKNGKITNLESKDQDLIKEVERLISIDEEASRIGELGIGLNPGAKLSGILLEDEKALNTAHIAFGNNTDLDGGQNNSLTHRDFLFYKPTIEVTFKDNSTKVLIRKGEFVLDGKNPK
ncbi:MAG: aminopeptidase [Candidatus Thorarchaeota archaeon]